MRFGISWPLGRGRRAWLSGPVWAWLFILVALGAFAIVWAVVWCLVALVQLAFYGLRALWRKLTN